MNTIDEKDVDPIIEMYRISQSILSLDLRGFKETYRSAKPGELIFDSEWCRIRLFWDGWDPSDGNIMRIQYGRLHAPNAKNTMFWNGEECHCWHRVEHPLHFLDGISPADAVKLNYSHFIKTQFHSDEFQQKYVRRQPEWLAEIHAAIWKYYGDRLFELFDLRKPELWQQYRLFLKEFYEIKGRRAAIKPSLDKVC